MKWSYRRYSVDPSRICPTGIAFRPEAKIRLIGLTGETYLRVLIDTGADHSIFPYSVAEDVGAELFRDETESAKGVGGHEVTVIPGRVELELLDGDESCQWTATVGFAKFDTEEGECSLLGHAGCLEYFFSTFDGESQVVELSPRGNLPGVG